MVQAFKKFRSSIKIFEIYLIDLIRPILTSTTILTTLCNHARPTLFPPLFVEIRPYGLTQASQRPSSACLGEPWRRRTHFANLMQYIASRPPLFLSQWGKKFHEVEIVCLFLWKALQKGSLLEKTQAATTQRKNQHFTRPTNFKTQLMFFQVFQVFYFLETFQRLFRDF